MLLKILDEGKFLELMMDLERLRGFLADNSCSDPECCGGPYYDESDYQAGIDALADLGIKLEL